VIDSIYEWNAADNKCEEITPANIVSPHVKPTQTIIQNSLWALELH
jgi:hypothetical protein